MVFTVPSGGPSAIPLIEVMRAPMPRRSLPLFSFLALDSPPMRKRSLIRFSRGILSILIYCLSFDALFNFSPLLRCVRRHPITAKTGRRYDDEVRRSAGLNSFKKAVRSVEIQQAVPPSVNHPNAAFDSLPEPDAATLELFRSLTPRDAAGAYLAVALGPMRDSALLRDAQIGISGDQDSFGEFISFLLYYLHLFILF